MEIIFTQPFLVNAALAERATGHVAVLDIAFNGGSPMGKGTNAEQFEATTVAFIEALGDRLAVWVDHHPHKAWSNYSSDPRFVLVPREEAPACPPLITPELTGRYGQIDTIVCHGDFDGVMSAVKYILGGEEPYEGANADSIAADSRIGSLSPKGLRLEEAMKADLRDDLTRYNIVNALAFSDEDASAEIDKARERYATLRAETERLAALYKVKSRVAYVDAFSASEFDLTALLLAGQKIAEVAVVRDSINEGKDALIVVAGPRNWNFVEMFGLGGGMPNRVNLPDQDVSKVIEKINA